MTSGRLPPPPAVTSLPRPDILEMIKEEQKAKMREPGRHWGGREEGGYNYQVHYSELFNTSCKLKTSL